MSLGAALPRERPILPERGLPPHLAALAWLRFLLPVQAFLIALAYVFPVSIALMNVAMGILTGTVLFEALHRRRCDALRGWQVPAVSLLVFLVVTLGAATGGLDAERGYKVFTRDFHKLWAFFLFLIALAQEPSPALWRPYGLSVMAMCALGAAQAALGRLPGGAWMRAHGSVHPVTFGGMLALSFVAAVPLAVRREAEGPSRTQVSVFLAVVGAGLALNQTRIALLAVGAGLAVLAAFEPRIRRHWKGALAAAVLLVAAWEYGPFKRPLVRPLLAYAAVFVTGREAVMDPNSLSVRLPLWRAAWDMFRDHPWLGVGPGSFPVAFPRYFQGTIEQQAVWGSAHNQLLQQLATRGLLGAVALAGVLGAFAWRVRRSPEALALLATFLVLNATETAWDTEQLMTLWLFLTVRTGFR